MNQLFTQTIITFYTFYVSLFEGTNTNTNFPQQVCIMFIIFKLQREVSGES